MKRKQIQYEIAEQQRKMTVAVLESIAVTLFAVVTAALLPQLIYQVIMQNEQLVNSVSNLFLLKYMPHIAYMIAFGYFIMGVLGNFVRARKVRALQRELSMLDYTEDGCCCGQCEECRSDMVPAAADEDVEALASAMKATKKTTKKSIKKTTKK